MTLGRLGVADRDSAVPTLTAKLEAADRPAGSVAGKPIQLVGVEFSKAKRNVAAFDVARAV